ncbi:Uncharacterised protein [Mycobacterium tuberculosis]|nr:Uncharacterised protein [Mycobacterium tuberculosis]
MKSSPTSRNSMPSVETAVPTWLRVSSSTEISFFQIRIRFFFPVIGG